MYSWVTANYLLLIWIVFLVFCVYSFWAEARKDGFDKYWIFDLLVTLGVVSFLLYLGLTRWYDYLTIYHYDSLFLKIKKELFVWFLLDAFWLGGLAFFARYLKWSVFRLLDTFALIQSYAMLALLIKTRATVVELVFGTLLVLILIFYKKRHIAVSGTGMVILLLAQSVFLLLRQDLQGRLLIAGFLFTISVLVIYFRRQSSMANLNFTQDFIKFIKRSLYNKEKELQKQASLLRAEDPYLQPGRAEGNSDEMDEAILEDSRKELTDVKLGLVGSMLKQVKRALAFIKIGKYGICEICGNAIDEARLRVYPEATKCVNCAARSGG